MMLMVFVAFELLSFCILATLVIVVCRMVVWRAVAAVSFGTQGQGRAAKAELDCTVNVWLCRWPWARSCASLLAVGGFFFSIAEAQMLLDMGVHVMDAELMAVAGVGIVVERRVNLGVDLTPAGWRLVVVGLVTLSVLEPLLLVISIRVAEWTSRKQVMRIVASTGTLWLVMYGLVFSQSALLQEKQQQFAQVRTPPPLSVRCACLSQRRSLCV
jgi:hypothetical protein